MNRYQIESFDSDSLVRLVNARLGGQFGISAADADVETIEEVIHALRTDDRLPADMDGGEIDTLINAFIAFYQD